MLSCSAATVRMWRVVVGLMRSVRLWLVISLTLIAVACREEPPFPRIERLAPPADGRLAVPAEWIEQYRRLLRDAGGGALVVSEVGDHAAAARAVRQGAARFAIIAGDTPPELAGVEFDAPALALTVPLTFPVEELTLAQVGDLLGGRLRNWRDSGGPSLAVSVVYSGASTERELIRRVTGEPPAVAAPAIVNSAVPGAVVIGAWEGPALGRKALRINGLLPGADSYPLAEHRRVAGRPETRAEVEALAATLRRRLEARRPATVVLDAVGDIMLDREVGRLIESRGPVYPLDAVRPLLAEADLRFGNLELPLTTRGAPANKDYVFRAPPSSTLTLTHAGFNLLSLANNHAADYGSDGLLDTLDALTRAGIAYAGAGRTADEAHAPALVTVKGIRIALLAYVNVPDDSVSGFSIEETAAGVNRPGVAWGTVEAVRRDVAAAAARADLVIVSLHSGYEYTEGPNATQRGLARAAVDAGAALVLGGHPHVLQGVEFYRGAPIIYSLGNFVFDLDDDDRRQAGLPSLLSVIFRVTLTREGVRGVQFLPVLIDPHEGRPLPVAGAAARPVLERLYRLTDALR